MGDIVVGLLGNNGNVVESGLLMVFIVSCVVVELVVGVDEYLLSIVILTVGMDIYIKEIMTCFTIIFFTLGCEGVLLVKE